MGFGACGPNRRRQLLLTFPRVHIIGAGMAGLAAAVDLAGRGRAVSLSDSAAQAGGRCRSYFDPQIGARIDNGNHLVLSGNPAVAQVSGGDRGVGQTGRAGQCRFSLGRMSATGERWRISPSAGRIPWWVLNAGKRVPGTGVGDYLPLTRFLKPRRARRSASCCPSAGRCGAICWSRSSFRR